MSIQSLPDSNEGQSIYMNEPNFLASKEPSERRQAYEIKSKFNSNNPLNKEVSLGSFRSKNSSSNENKQVKHPKIIKISKESNQNIIDSYTDDQMSGCASKEESNLPSNNNPHLNSLTLSMLDNTNQSLIQDTKNNMLNISNYNNTPLNSNLTISDVCNQNFENSILTLNPRSHNNFIGNSKLSNSIGILDHENKNKLRNYHNTIRATTPQHNTNKSTFGTCGKKGLQKEDTEIKKVLTNLSIKNNLISNTNNILNGKSLFFIPDRIQKLKEYFKLATKRIIINQETFINNTNQAVQENNIQKIRIFMLSQDNKQMFKQQLSNQTLLNFMLIQGRMEMLQEILKDPFYELDGTFVFDYLSKKLKQKNQLLEDIDDISQFISNVVTYNLYRKSLTRVLGWFIICLGFNDTFVQLVKTNEKEYSLDCIQFNQFESDEDIRDYLEEPSNYRRVLILCLKEKLEHLAIELILFHGSLEHSEVIESAIQYNSKTFLRFIWEATSCSKKNLGNQTETRKGKKNLHISSSHSVNANTNIQEVPSLESIRKRHFHSFTFFEASMKQTIFNKGNLVFMISDLIEKIYRIGNKELIVEIVSLWKNLDKDKNLLQALLNKQSYDEISILLYRYPYNSQWKFTEENFKEIIENCGLDLILLCLQDAECRHILENPNIQEIIISHYLSEGEKMYYGSEMLSYISKTSFDLSLVSKLLSTINLAIKKCKIINCHSPVLTCLLLCEFITYIGEISVHFETKCKRTRKDLMLFCRHVQEAKPNDQYVKFLLGQKDSRGRAAYQIAAEIEAYAVLQSPEVGTIVNKMWVGKISYDSIFDFSSIYRFISNQNPDETNPMKAFKPMDVSKAYFHQLALWKTSCSVRFIPESLLTVLLIVLYNLFIYFLVIDKAIMLNTNELSPSMQTMLICYIVWVICIALNTPLQILYCYLSGRRKFSLDRWGVIDICLVFASFFVLLDTEKLFPSYDEDGRVVPSNGTSDFSFLLRATILSVNNVLVWLRITSILITYRELGPLIRMIYQLSIFICQYLIVFIILMICFATFFTTVFFRVSNSFRSYIITFTTLFQGFLNNSDYFDFKSYKMFGAICVLIFVTACGLILVNGPIALLSNKYTKLSKVVDAAHRSVLITYYKRFKWDKNYGYLIFFAPPLSVLNFITMPINILIRKNLKLSKEETINKQRKSTIIHDEKLSARTAKQQIFNKKLCNIYFSIFYFPIIALFGIICNILFLPIGYIVGFGKGMNASNGNAFSCNNILILICWLVCGPFILIYRIFVDLLDMIKTMFIESSAFEKETEKGYFKEAKNFREEIKNFIIFIHKREKTEQNDLNSIFLDYLEYEHNKQLELNEETKKESQQGYKVREKDKRQSKNHGMISLIYGNKMKINNNNSSNNTNFDLENDNYYETKMRNVIIIQILQNFVIKGERNDIFIVDIEKMKMLLPITMNINNSYMKRLLYTNITTLNKAVSKKKNKANPFLQHKMLNVIASSVIRLNSLIDGEVNTDPLQTDEAKAKYDVDIQDNEDNFYSEIADLLEKMEIDITESVKKEEKLLYAEEQRAHMHSTRQHHHNRHYSKKTIMKELENQN